MFAVDLSTVATSAVVSAVVSLGVSGLLRVAVDGVRSAWTRWRTRRNLLANGDHKTIARGSLVPLGPGTKSSRVGIRVAPALQFPVEGPLSVEDVERWVSALTPTLLQCREHSDPTEVIRYARDGQRVEVRPSGLVEVHVAVGDVVAQDSASAFELDLESVVQAVLPVIASLAAGGYLTLFQGRMRTQRLDWRFDIGRPADNNPNSSGRTRGGLRFPGRAPKSSTPGQPTPLAGDAGFGGKRLRNIAVDTDPVEILMIFLTDLIERSGYAGAGDALADLRIEAEAVAYMRAGGSVSPSEA